MKLRYLLAGSAAAIALCMPLATTASASSAKPVIGFSIDDLRVERWARDRDYFTAAAKELGADVIVTSADANEQKQVNQVENMISQKVDAIVVVPMNSKVFAEVIDEAHKAGIPVATVEALKAALAENKKTAEFKLYPGAPHGFHADYRASYRKEAADDAWANMQAWFKKYGVLG